MFSLEDTGGMPYYSKRNIDAGAGSPSLRESRFFKEEENMKIVCLCLVLLCVSSWAFAETDAGAPAQKGIALPCILNTVPGFGLGSFIQGDIPGGVILAVGDAASWAGIFIGALAAIGDDPTVLIVSTIAFWAFKIFGIVKPIWFGLEYNAKLEERTASFSVTPTLVSARRRGGVAPAVNVRVAVPLN
jgi:hypothetical protein